jgi:hypothetical protein
MKLRGEGGGKEGNREGGVVGIYGADGQLTYWQHLGGQQVIYKK